MKLKRRSPLTGAQEVTKNRTSNNNNPINILFVFIKINFKMFLLEK